MFTPTAHLATFPFFFVCLIQISFLYWNNLIQMSCKRKIVFFSTLPCVLPMNIQLLILSLYLELTQKASSHRIKLHRHWWRLRNNELKLDKGPISLTHQRTIQVYQLENVHMRPCLPLDNSAKICLVNSLKSKAFSFSCFNFFMREKANPHFVLWKILTIHSKMPDYNDTSLVFTGLEQQFK